MLDYRGNNKSDSNWGYNEMRGGEKYYPPKGWHRYGISVLDKYDNKNNDWLSYDNRKGEWCICYSGLSREKEKNYENDDDLKHPGKKVGLGVYVSPKPEEMEKRVFAINTLEYANNEKIQRYCYRPIRNPFIKDLENGNDNKDYKENKPHISEISKNEDNSFIEHESVSSEKQYDNIANVIDQIAPTQPATDPQQVVYNVNVNANANANATPDKGNASILMDNRLNKGNAAMVEDSVNLTDNENNNGISNSNSNSYFYRSPNMDSVSTKDKDLMDMGSSIPNSDQAYSTSTTEVNRSNSGKRDSTSDSTKKVSTYEIDNNITLGSSGGGGDNNPNSMNDIVRSQESLKLKLIDIVLPEDLTNSQSKFIFECDSRGGSQLNLSDRNVSTSTNIFSQQSISTATVTEKNNNTDSLEKKLFKKKYVPSKLGGEPLTLNSDDTTEVSVGEDSNKFHL